MSIEAMRQARNALVWNLNTDLDNIPVCDQWAKMLRKNIDALDKAIADAELKWVGLTQAERHDIREWQKIQEKLGPVWAPMMLYLYEAIEAKLKQKNGYAEEKNT